MDALRPAKHAAAKQVDWDSEAATWSQKCWPLIDGYYRLVDTAHIEPADLVLDLGCGVGHMGALAAHKQGSPNGVYFLDLSAKMIELAKRYVSPRQYQREIDPQG